MSERLIKPYEISVWEDKLTQNGFIENKLAVIGSDTMTGLNKVYDPVFNKKSNGEKTLSFSLKYKYFDPYSGNSDYVNPFAALLTNERKVKLHYDNQWYEFIVKDHTESSDESTWTYTCIDAFVLELSKNGYNITFDSELNNNQGTAKELAEETLKDTDWQVSNVDVGRQTIAEPIYKATLVSTTGIEIINTDDTAETVSDNTAIYLFYSYIKNKNGKFVQFIINDEHRQYTIDDNNVITDTNFRIKDELEYKEDGFYKGNDLIISFGEIEIKYQANRLVYSQRTTYDPVTKRTVDIFKVDDRDIYRYTDYTYTTSNVVMNYITNGDNFNELEDGSLQGWNPYVDFTPIDTNDKIDKLELVTRPELGTGKELADIDVLSQIEGFLKAKFKGPFTEYKNAIFNSGIENNSSFIKSISKGDKFVFRWRAGIRDPEKLTDEYILTTDIIVDTNKIYYKKSGEGTEQDPYVYKKVIDIESGTNPNAEGWYEKNISDVNCLVSYHNLRLLVAKYTQDEPTRYGYYYKHIDPDNIIIQFNGIPKIYNNIINGGSFIEAYRLTNDTEIIEDKTYYIKVEEDGSYTYAVILDPTIDNIENYYESYKEYVINDIVQTPSTKYVYQNETDGQEYIWNGLIGDFELKTNDNYLPYYYLVGEANKAIPNVDLTDITQKFGIFIYTIDGLSPVYIQDIQLTRFVPDGETENPILIGNVPTATSIPTSYYYLKPADGTAAEDVITYTDLNKFAEDLDTTVDNIQPVYNEDSTKILSINASQSNCFNILQTIAETFECWIDLSVVHDAQGYIERDEDGQPLKYVYLRQYAGKDNYAGFKYGINLNSIERTINSDEIVTKLIVDQSQSEYVDEGFISISNAPSNQSGESYILNFDYFYNQGLLNREEVEEDKLVFLSHISALNIELQEKEKERRDLEASLITLGSKRNVYTELINTAQETQTKSLATFEDLTGQSYEDYKAEHITLEEDNQLTEEETILDLLGKLYISSATINNYVGILTNIEQEYWNIRKRLRGSENYNIKIWTGVDDNQQRHVFVELNDFLPKITFTLGENSYQTTISKKYFDIETLETSITFEVPDGYTIESSSYEIIDETVQKINITADETIEGVEDEIEELQQQKNDLTTRFNNKYRRFIQEGTWNSTEYIDSELYYLDALQVSNTSAQPTVSYTINVVEISELEGFEWYLFDAGDKTYVEDTEFFGWANINGHLTPAREEVIVSEVEWHLDEPENNVITVQNYKTRFEDLFQRISAAVQTVQYNEATYAKISTLLDDNGTINQDVLLESLNRISGQNYNLTSDGSVLIDGDQILVQNLTNPANRVIINSEGIRISADGGQTWRTAIDGQGINIGTVYTGMLNTNSVVIGSEDNPSFRWDKSGISAYKSNNETGVYDLQTYVRYDEYGLYGIKEGGSFKAQNLNDVLDKAHFAVTWDGFFIKNSYQGGGKVEITSDNDFRVLSDPQLQGNFQETIKIGALEWGRNGDIPIINPNEPGATELPTLYGIRIKNNNGTEVFKTGTDGNIEITGTINATGGNFSGIVNVGPENQNHIVIDGRNINHSPSIASSNYQDGAGYGWMINKDGDAIFNNITARGAIKTAVFEYAEIQAVGGIFIFRPSSTIKNAQRVGQTNDIIITVEKPHLFKVGDWCKISNYTNTVGEPQATSVLSSNGLTHVYKIKSIDSNNTRILTLENAYSTLVTGQYKVIDSIIDLIGGALVNMGNKDNGDGKVGSNNYGIGINSSDNVVNLPARAISLFETIVDENNYPKVKYNYKGILGTLPVLSYTGPDAEVSQLYNDYLAGTQGIYTNNMYLGDANQYLTFYTDETTGEKKLRIKASQVVYEVYDKDTGQPTGEWNDVNNIETDGPLNVVIESNIGNFILRTDTTITLTCTVYQGNNDITNQVTNFTWTKKNQDGSIDANWIPTLASVDGRSILINASDIQAKAIFICEVEF